MILETTFERLLLFINHSENVKSNV